MIGSKVSRHAVLSLEEVAAGWALEQEAGLDARRIDHLRAWIAEAPEHGTAYDRACLALQTSTRYRAEPEMMALRKAALKARPDRRSLPRAWAAAVAATLVTVSAGAWWALDQRPSVRDVGSAVLATAPGFALYETAVGERSTITLPDGSIMNLNTASIVQVAYSGSERRVNLVKGQALFDVVHDASTPFSVHVADRVVTATGTVFDVYLDGTSLRVAMLEGTVEVTEARRSPLPPEALSAGEVLLAAPGAPTRVRSENVEQLAVWRSGLVSFEDTRLSEAVEEINRYTSRPIVLADAEAGLHRVSGTFRAAEPDRFARTLSDLFPLTLSSEDGQFVLSSREK